MQSKNGYVEFELLSRCALLQGLPPEVPLHLLAEGTSRRVEAKLVVFSRGDAGDEIYFLLSGGVKVSALSQEGREIVFDVLVTPDLFGEVSLFDGRPRTGTVTTLVPSALLILRKEHFLDLLASHPEVALRLLKTLASRLRMMDAFVEDVLFLDAEARLAKRVMALSRIFGRTGSNGEIRIDLKVSQQEMANLVGITRESVNKHFRGWERSGSIGLEKGCLVLQQPSVIESLITEAV